MASAGSQGPSASGPLQFDHAEFAAPTPGAAGCSICQRPIAGVYYELDGQVLCEPCARGVDAGLLGGSRFLRFVKAGVYGTAAAVGGTILIYLFREITGLEAAVISILAGFMVGSAVKQGSEYRGGRLYQVMAVFLTYSALSWSYLPYIYRELAANVEKALTESPDAGKAAVKKEAPALKKGGASDAPASKVEPGKADDRGKPRKEDAAGAKAAGVVEAGRPPVNAANPFIMFFVLAFLLLFVLAFSYAAPIIGMVSGFPQGLIGIVIVFWGLQQAWRLARKTSLDFRGPFRVGGNGPSQAGVSAHG